MDSIFQNMRAETMAEEEFLAEDLEEECEVPWTTNDQVWNVVRAKEKRRSLVKFLAGSKMSVSKAASDFLNLCFDKNFRNYLHPYK